MTARLRRMAALAAVIGVLLSALVLAAPAASAAPGPATAPEWWFDDWNVPGLWAEGANGTGITIAVIDTGVQASIPELAGKVLPGADFTGQGGDGTTDYDSDEFGHGTAMASLMVASAGYANIQGLAPEARLLPIAVPLKGAGRTAAAVTDALPTAIRYAVDHGAKIISMSLGGYRDPSVDSVPCPQAHQDAISYAISKGAIVVAAGGNAGEQGSPVEEPGVCLGVISVGAVDSTKAASSFSSRHPYLTATAPGENIPTLSRVASTAYVGEGTSQATAITSAALALIWSKYPTLSGEQVATKLLATTEDLGPAGRDEAYGLGLIRPDQAIHTAVPAAADNPVWDGIAPYLPSASPSGSSTAGGAGGATPGAPAATGSNPPGVVVISAAEPAIPAMAVFGTAVALWGLLVLILLAIVGLRRRRRRRRNRPPDVAVSTIETPKDEADGAGAAEPADETKPPDGIRPADHPWTPSTH